MIYEIRQTYTIFLFSRIGSGLDWGNVEEFEDGGKKNTANRQKESAEQKKKKKIYKLYTYMR